VLAHPGACGLWVVFSGFKSNPSISNTISQSGKRSGTPMEKSPKCCGYRTIASARHRIISFPSSYARTTSAYVAVVLTFPS
jgi:hypothetical protein